MKHGCDRRYALTASTTKKAVIRRYDKESLTGYINPLSFLQPAGVELLSAQGNVSVIPYEEIKIISFVRDFETGGTHPAGRSVFFTRPKIEGLWLSLEFRDGDVMEGVMPNDLLHLEHYGFTVIPPDAYSTVQRVFIPRLALRSVQVLGVVGSPLQKRKPKTTPKEQIGLFEDQP